MSEAVLITAITVFGGGLLAVWIEQIRTRKAVGSNGGSTLHDGMAEVRRDVREIRKEQTKQGERIAKLEGMSS